MVTGFFVAFILFSFALFVRLLVDGDGVVDAVVGEHPALERNLLVIHFLLLRIRL